MDLVLNCCFCERMFPFDGGSNCPSANTVKSQLWNHNRGITFVKSHPWNHICEITLVKSHPWNHTCGITIVESHLWNHTCEITPVESQSWNHTNQKNAHIDKVYRGLNLYLSSKLFPLFSHTRYWLCSLCSLLQECWPSLGDSPIGSLGR